MAKQTPNQILTSEHVFIAGMTGTGKTYLAKSYLSQFPTVGILDSKGDAVADIAKGKNPWPQVPKKELTVITKLADLEYVETPYHIYSPNMDEVLDKDFFFEEYFKWAYYRRNITILVDEAMEVSENPHSIPRHYKGILTRGRTRDVSVWSCTQRPAGLSGMIISQSKHIFMFNLRKVEDRKKISNSTGVPEFLDNPSGHYFWYWKDGMTHAAKGIIK